MRSILSGFPTDILTLHNGDGSAQQVKALVDSNHIMVDDINVIIEEGDIFERALPNGTKEFFRVTDRGFMRGNRSIPDHYQTTVQKIPPNTAPKDLNQIACTASKPHKLFVSHSSDDKEYMFALTEMLEDIGMPEGSFVCTSVPGYGIPGGENIFDWLLDQFLNCDLRVLFSLSHNYYRSAACLNEMGAAWVTKTTDTLLLLPGFDFGEIAGCIDSRKVGICFNKDDRELKHRLNEFKDTLISEHGLQKIQQSKWERKRDKFINAVREIAKKNIKCDGDELEDH